MLRPKRLENHHLAGRCNSEITVTLCVEDHIRISNRQMCWDPRWTLPNNTESLKISFILQGVQELLIQKHFKTNLRDYRLLADSLSSMIKRYRDAE